MAKSLRFFCFSIEFVFAFIIALLIDLTIKIPNEKFIQIEPGSITKIIINLNEKYGGFSKIDTIVLRILGTPQHGLLEFSNTNLAKIDFLNELIKAKPVMESFMLIPGETTLIFFRQIAKDFNLSEEKLNAEFKAIAPFYEGFIVPETYKFAKNRSEKDIVKMLVSHSLKFHEKLSREITGDFNISSWKNVIIKASVIQKEAANVAEMPIISGVIDNRIAKNMKLQMDGTLNYGEFSHIKVTPERIKNDTSEFNTYIIDGLPKSAVCVVSKSAIIAALKPQKSEYLYFMRNKKTGLHDFAKTLTEHNKNVAKWR